MTKRLIVILLALSLVATIAATKSTVKNPNKVKTIAPVTNTVTTAGVPMPPMVLSAAKTTVKTPKYLTGGLPPVIQSNSVSLIATQGSIITFYVSATATNTPRYQWSKDGNKIAGATQSTYSITNVQPTNVGMYSVLVTNLYGEVSAKMYMSLATTNILPNCTSNVTWVTLAWDAPCATNIAGHYIHYGIGNSGTQTNVHNGYTNDCNQWIPAETNVHHLQYTNKVTIPITNGNTGTISNITVGVTYYFIATRFDVAGLESDWSKEVSFTAMAKTTNFSLQIVMLPTNVPRIQTKLCPNQKVILQWTSNFKSWSNLSTNIADPWGNVIYDDTDAARGPYRFYRGTF